MFEFIQLSLFSSELFVGEQHRARIVDEPLGSRVRSSLTLRRIRIVHHVDPRVLERGDRSANIVGQGLSRGLIDEIVDKRWEAVL